MMCHPISHNTFIPEWFIVKLERHTICCVCCHIFPVIIYAVKSYQYNLCIYFYKNACRLSQPCSLTFLYIYLIINWVFINTYFKIQFPDVFTVLEQKICVWHEHAQFKVGDHFPDLCLRYELQWVPSSKYIFACADTLHLLWSFSKPRVVLIGPEQCVMSLADPAHSEGSAIRRPNL